MLNYDPINQGERDVYHRVEPSGRLPGITLAAGTKCWDDSFTQWRLVRRLAAVGWDQGGRLPSDAAGGGWVHDRRDRAVGRWHHERVPVGNGAPPEDGGLVVLGDELSVGPGELDAGRRRAVPARFLKAGLDKTDFFIAWAGEPAILLGQEFDFFDDRGLRQAHGELLRLHRLMGGSTKTCRLSMGSREHEYSDEQQRAMVAFFNQVARKPAPAPDRPIEAPTEEDLQVTPGRDVADAGSMPVYELVARQAANAAAARPKVVRGALAETVRRVLGVRLPRRAPHHRRLFQTGGERTGTGQRVYRFALEPEPGMLCLLRHVCREQTPYRMSPSAVHYPLPPQHQQRG